MQENKGEKMPLYEGKDGKLYFNFAQGLEVQMHGSDCDRNANYTFKIVGCRYIGTTEYYDVAIDGVLKPVPDSANRVKFLISRFGVKTLCAGKRLELPLTVEEVKTYFEYLEYTRERARREASQIEEYVSLKAEAAALAVEEGRLNAYDRKAEAEALEQQRAELERRAEEVLTAHGIAPEDIAEPGRCRNCGGWGYIHTHVCDCALPHAQKIKDYNAQRRLRLKALIGSTEETR